MVGTVIKKPGQISPTQNKLSVEVSKFRAKCSKRIIHLLSKYLLITHFILCTKYTQIDNPYAQETWDLVQEIKQNHFLNYECLKGRRNSGEGKNLKFLVVAF